MGLAWGGPDMGLTWGGPGMLHCASPPRHTMLHSESPRTPQGLPPHAPLCVPPALSPACMLPTPASPPLVPPPAPCDAGAGPSPGRPSRDGQGVTWEQGMPAHDRIQAGQDRACPGVREKQSQACPWMPEYMSRGA